MRDNQDIGGRPAGPIDLHEHRLDDFERHIDALCLMLCVPPTKCVAVEELRRAKEDMLPQDFDRVSYYERWTVGLKTVLVEKGVLDEAEVAARMRALRARSGTAS